MGEGSGENSETAPSEAHTRVWQKRHTSEGHGPRAGDSHRQSDHTPNETRPRGAAWSHNPNRGQPGPAKGRDRVFFPSAGGAASKGAIADRNQCQPRPASQRPQPSRAPPALCRASQRSAAPRLQAAAAAALCSWLSQGRAAGMNSLFSSVRRAAAYFAALRCSVVLLYVTSSVQGRVLACRRPLRPTHGQGRGCGGRAAAPRVLLGGRRAAAGRTFSSARPTSAVASKTAARSASASAGGAIRARAARGRPAEAVLCGVCTRAGVHDGESRPWARGCLLHPCDVVSCDLPTTAPPRVRARAPPTLPADLFTKYFGQYVRGPRLPCRFQG